MRDLPTTQCQFSHFRDFLCSAASLLGLRHCSSGKVSHTILSPISMQKIGVPISGPCHGAGGQCGMPHGTLDDSGLVRLRLDHKSVHFSGPIKKVKPLNLTWRVKRLCFLVKCVLLIRLCFLTQFFWLCITASCTGRGTLPVRILAVFLSPWRSRLRLAHFAYETRMAFRRLKTTRS